MVFLSRHKLLWSGLKELKLLLALDTAVALGNAPAFLRSALGGSHLLRGQGHIPNVLFVFKNEAQAPEAPQQPSDPHCCWFILL